MVKKAIILKAPGTNNDYETHYAFTESGALSEIVHINELVSGEKKLNCYDILVIPGGFSYGDDLGAGKVLSLFMQYKLKNQLAQFIKRGSLVIGICNGFQMLVKSGILPDLDGKQKVTLTFNENGRFISRWVKVRINNKLFWFDGLPEEIELPIAHMEGRFIAGPSESKRLKEKGQISLYYIDNPNGSEDNIGGIVGSGGNILGLMPHPERCFHRFQHPNNFRGLSEPWGRIIFRNIIKNA